MGFLRPDLEGAYHFTEHFAEVAKGSRAEKVQLGIEVLTDLKTPMREHHAGQCRIRNSPFANG